MAKKLLGEIKTGKSRGKKKKLAPVADLFSFATTATTNQTTAEAVLEDIASVEKPEQILGVHDYLDYVSHIIQVASNIKVLGEISRITHHQTGVYITLKDKETDSVLSCYVNPYTYRGLGLQLEDGMEIKITGTPSIFKRRSELSLRADNIELAGEGALKKQYELLKLKLQAEGLFDRKRSLPEFVHSVGIITSRSGAVIDDFRNNIGKLGCKLYLRDCRVEGSQAVNHILSAIQYFNQHYPDLDCLVIMRGGGSLEDLQAFNNEQVVRAMFASKITTICAIGHDRDIPLAQLVADSAHSTPTAAAICITQTWSRLQQQLPQLERDIVYGYKNYVINTRRRIESANHRLVGKMEGLMERYNQLRSLVLRGSVLISGRIEQIKLDAERFSKNFQQSIKATITQSNERITNFERMLESNNPERQLKLGYSLVRSGSGKIIRSSKELRVGETLQTTFHEGRATSEITEIN